MPEPELSLLEKGLSGFQFVIPISKTDGLIPAYAIATLGISSIMHQTFPFSLGHTFALLRHDGPAVCGAKAAMGPAIMPLSFPSGRAATTSYQAFIPGPTLLLYEEYILT
jgi:hypothetical protein